MSFREHVIVEAVGQPEKKEFKAVHVTASVIDNRSTGNSQLPIWVWVWRTQNPAYARPGIAHL